jgi:histone acetyltransferase 1
MDHPEEDGLSCAAACMQFTIDYKDKAELAAFHPVYTHQIFPGERIPGYHPYSQSTYRLLQQKSPSFQYPATHTLLVRIQMVPDCTSCAVSVFKKAEDQSEIPIHSRKRAREADDDASANIAAMPMDQIVERLRKYLPPINDVCIHENAADIPMTRVSPFPPSNRTSDASFLSKPLGKVLQEYQQVENSFVISLCDGPDCVNYHSAVQKWAWYFIETAEDIDVNDSSWKVLYLFRKHDSTSLPQYSLVGYMTLYSFANPFRRPKPGTILRICQAMVLPHYQRQGHGARLYHAIYNHVVASATLHPIVEVNVEDPAPAFSFLRLLVDYERYLGRTAPWFHPDGTPTLEAQEHTPTTTQQMQRVYEVDQLRRLLLQDQVEREDNLPGKIDTEEEQWKRFRLSVKRRLHQERREELPEDKAEQKRQLEEMYQQVLRQYRKVLRKARIPELKSEHHLSSL